MKTVNRWSGRLPRTSHPPLHMIRYRRVMALLRNTHAFCVRRHQHDHLVLLVARVSKGCRIV